MERNRFSVKKKTGKSLNKKNKTIALNTIVPHNTKQIRHVYKLKYNFKRKNQVILLMITDGKKWHYLDVKRLSALLRGITSNHKEGFSCLNCFHSYRAKNKKHERVCNDHDYCYVEMPNKDN